MCKQDVWRKLFANILLILLLSGCSQNPTEQIQIQTTTAPISKATNTPTPSETPLPPTETSTETPTETPVPATSTPTKTETPFPTDTNTPVATETPTNTYVPQTQAPNTPTASRGPVWIYYIQLNTGGPVACGDSAFAVSSGIARTGNISEDVAAGLSVLFNNNQKYSNYLYNPLYASRIRVENVTFNSGSGLITVQLRGTYKPSGDDCDNTRVRAQVWMTVRQYKAVTKTNIYLNGIPFGDRVSNDK